MRIREPTNVSVLALTESQRPLNPPRHTDIRNFRESPPPPPPAIVATTKRHSRTRIAPGDRTTLQSAFQSTATTLTFNRFICKLLNEHLHWSSESVTELVVRLCDTFH